MEKLQRIAVIGGGLSGLVAARELRRLRPTVEIILIEAKSELGGVLKTESIGDYLVEQSADMFSTEPGDALALIQELGQEENLIGTLPVQDRAWLASPHDPSEILPVPRGFSMMLPGNLDAVCKSGILDSEGAARFLAERDVPPKEDEGDESLESFAVRRFGQQTFDRLIQPLISGIYTADPKKLSMRATMLRFVELEQRYGSLIRAAEANQSGQEHRDNRLAFADQTASGARYDLFRAPSLGMSQLLQWLMQDLSDVEIRTQTRVDRLERSPSGTGWRLTLNQAESRDKEVACSREPTQLEVDGILLTTSARVSASLLQEIDPNVAAELKSLETAGCAVALLGYEERQFGRKFSGYGIVVPSILKRNLIAVSFSSNKFAGRAPAGRTLLRCFVGGALRPELLEKSDDELLQLVKNELKPMLQINGEPELQKVFRWEKAMPQYHLGHIELVKRIEKRLTNIANLELAGNSYNGVGIPACVREGRSAARRLARCEC